MGLRVGTAGVIMHHSLVNRWPLAETVGASRPYLALLSLVNPLLSIVRLNRQCLPSRFLRPRVLLDPLLQRSC
jgi:hypothetical protein